MATPAAPTVTAISVGDDGFRFRTDDEDVVDVCFDGRRIWSFWLQRDSEAVPEGRHIAWPGSLNRFLKGTTRLTLVAHVTDVTLYDEEITLGSGEGRIAVVNEHGAPLGLDKYNRISQTFETRTAEQVAPLLDSIEAVLAAIKEAGIEAFPAYGTLLGAVRDNALIGHDNDADLGYVSRHTHPVDVSLESFALQRRLSELGYRTHRYSTVAFRVEVIEPDGTRRGLDVFGGFIAPGAAGGPSKLYLMGEVGADFELDWIYPLGTTTLEGRTLPAPARPEKLLEAMYGPGWKVPDPAFHFETSRGTVRRLTGWFRGIQVHRNDWERRYSTLRKVMPDEKPSPLARYLHECEGVPAQLIDLGAGRGADALWFARQGSSVIALDFVPWGSEAVQATAAAEGLDLEVRTINLHSLRSWLPAAAQIAQRPGPRTILANHLIDAGNAAAREATWRVCDMVLRDGGRLYLDFWRGAGERNPSTMLAPVTMATVVAELTARGAVIVHQEKTHEKKATGEPGRALGRLVAEWPR